MTASARPEAEGRASSPRVRGNAWVIGFAEDGSPIPLLVRSDGAVVVHNPEGRTFKALSLDGISYPAG